MVKPASGISHRWRAASAMAAHQANNQAVLKGWPARMLNKRRRYSSNNSFTSTYQFSAARALRKMNKLSV